LVPQPIVRAASRVREYSCERCPGYCCIYPEIEVTPRDIERLAQRFDLTYEGAETRFTKPDAACGVPLIPGQPALRLLRIPQVWTSLP
jgi:hypothetical protein